LTANQNPPGFQKREHLKQAMFITNWTCWCRC